MWYDIIDLVDLEHNEWPWTLLHINYTLGIYHDSKHSSARKNINKRNILLLEKILTSETLPFPPFMKYGRLLILCE